MPRIARALACVFLVLLATSCACHRGHAPGIGLAPGVRHVGPYTLAGPENFLTGPEPLRSDGEINAVVEIPTGTLEKWEVRESGDMKWDFKDGKPRVVKYLGYPGNYGMIPRTLLPKELGGDGDPLDVIVLGPPVPRGTVVAARLIGVLRMLDGGEQDDKLIAVALDSPFADVDSLATLDAKFHGVSQIVEVWFTNYKGPGKMESKGFADEKEARRILATAIAEFSRHTPSTSSQN